MQQLTPPWSGHFSSFQSLSCVWLFATSWTAACQTSLSITNSWRLLKLMSLKSVMPFNHLFPASGSFPMSQFFASGGQCIGVSASASVLLMNIQDWLPLGLAGLISLQCGSLIQSVPSCWGSLMTVVDSDSQRQCCKSPETTWALSSSMVASALCCGSCSTFSIKDSPF